MPTLGHHIQQANGHPTHYSNHVSPGGQTTYAQHHTHTPVSYTSADVVHGLTMHSEQDLPTHDEGLSYDDELSPYDTGDAKMEMQQLRENRQPVRGGHLPLRESYSSGSLSALSQAPQQENPKIAGNGSRPDSVVNAAEADINPGMLAPHGVNNGENWGQFPFGDQTQHSQGRRPTDDGHSIITGIPHAHSIEFGDHSNVAHDTMTIPDMAHSQQHPFSHDDTNPPFSPHEANAYHNGNTTLYYQNPYPYTFPDSH